MSGVAASTYPPQWTGDAWSKSPQPPPSALASSPLCGVGELHFAQIVSFHHFEQIVAMPHRENVMPHKDPNTTTASCFAVAFHQQRE
jgi:hypothetical protein